MRIGHLGVLYNRELGSVNGLQNQMSEISEFFDRAGMDLYAMLTRLTLCKDAAEELIQELFLRLVTFRYIDKVGNLNAYAYRTAINLAFDWRSRQKPTPLRLDEADGPASNENPALSELVRIEHMQDVLNAIGQLEGISRDAFVMRYVEHESFNYIAEQLDKTPHQVRALCSKALIKLRCLLGGDETLFY